MLSTMSTYWPPSWNHLKLENIIITKWQKMKLFDARHVQYDIIKHLAVLCKHILLFSPKKAKNKHFYPKMA